MVLQVTNYIDIFSEILNLEGHLNCCIGSRVTPFLLNGWRFCLLVELHWEGSALQPAQQAFHQLGPLVRVGLVVAMCVCFSVCLFVCLMSPFHVIFLRGWTGAEDASSVDWCDLDLE